MDLTQRYWQPLEESVQQLRLVDSAASGYADSDSTGETLT